MTSRRSNLFAVVLVGGLWLLTPGATLCQEPQAPDVSAPLPLGQATLDADGDFVPDRIGQRLTVEGYTIMEGRRARADDGGDWFYLTIVDQTGGLRLFTRDEDQARDVPLGGWVSATGVLTHRRGSEELILEELSFSGRTEPILAREALAADLHGEELMHQLVRIEGMIRDYDVDTDVAILEDRSGTVPVRVTPRLMSDRSLSERIEAGGRVAIVGIVGQADREAPFDSDYRLAPREIDDFVWALVPPVQELAFAGLFLLVVGILGTYRMQKTRAVRRARHLEGLTTELERSKTRLEESARELEALFADDSVGRFVLDRQGRVRKWNDAFELFLSHPTAELDGRSLEELMQEAELVAVEDEEASAQSEVRLKGPDGSLKVGLITVTPLEVSAEMWALGTLIDVTERARLEDQLVRAAKMEAVGRLAGGVAHDINNMLSIILGNVELVNDEGPHDDEVEESVSEIRVAALRSGRLARQLLTMARRDIAQPRPLSLNDVVRDMIPMLKRVVGERSELVTRLAPETPPVLADLSQMEQVILNLTSNAAEATGAGGVITVETDRTEAGDGRLRVIDNGVGISEEDRVHLFEPFFTTKPEGSGLGLATVYGIVVAAGGSVGATPREGGGSVFEVTLPGIEAAKLSTPEEVFPPTPTRLSETVLVVEDELGVRESAVKFLEGVGCTVVAAADGEDALELLERNPSIDVLLTDVMMPRLDGRELARRARDLRPDLPIIYMSGFVDQSEAGGRGLVAGPFLQKPFERAQLLRVMDEVLSETPVESTS